MPISEERCGGMVACRVSGGRKRDKEDRGHADEGSRTPEGLIYCFASTCEGMSAAGRTAGGGCTEEI